jgi:hypothetical protein
VKESSRTTTRRRDAAGRMRATRRARAREMTRESTTMLSTEEEEGPWDKWPRRDGRSRVSTLSRKVEVA